MEADVKAMQQQALATQKTLDELQARETAGAGAAWGGSLPLAYGVWGLAAVVLLLALVQFWRQRRWRNVDVADFDDAHSDLPAGNGQAAVPTPQAAGVAPSRAAPLRTVAVEPEFADASDSDWGVGHAAEQDAQVQFDLERAASEVARVRAALAQRREARAQQRKDDARRLRDLTEQTQRGGLDAPGWSDSMPAPEVLDVASDDAVAPLSTASVPPVFWQRPSQRGSLPMPLTEPAADTSACEEQGETLPALDNAFAVKLALAKESAAVDLWIEARDLIREVLETDDPELLAQAQALMATMERRKDPSRRGT